MVLEFLLRRRDEDADARRMLDATCEAMARGGMYDQLGGGFARYSVDRGWVVPHFEKMLYDNAQLLGLYARWGGPMGERVAAETADFMLRELRTDEGGFASALDADSEGVEGKFYAWTPAELVDVLGPEDGAWAAQLFEVTGAGTFEHGSSTLQLLTDPDDPQRYADVRARLLAARETRVRPARDDKVVAAWNGLAISGLCDAGLRLGREEYVAAAVAAGELLARLHVDADGRLLRVSRDGVAGRHAGVLEDHGLVASAYLSLLQATGDPIWLSRAEALLEAALEHFRADDGGFHDTADHAETLGRPSARPVRQRQPVRAVGDRPRTGRLRRADGLRPPPTGGGGGAGHRARARREGATLRGLVARRRPGDARRTGRGGGHRPGGAGARRPGAARPRDPGSGGAGRRRRPGRRTAPARPDPGRRARGGVRVPQPGLRAPGDRSGADQLTPSRASILGRPRPAAGLRFAEIG